MIIGHVGSCQAPDQLRVLYNCLVSTAFFRQERVRIMTSLAASSGTTDGPCRLADFLDSVYKKFEYVHVTCLARAIFKKEILSALLFAAFPVCLAIRRWWSPSTMEPNPTVLYCKGARVDVLWILIYRPEDQKTPARYFRVAHAIGDGFRKAQSISTVSVTLSNRRQR